jgi:hypothetical protein
VSVHKSSSDREPRSEEPHRILAALKVRVRDLVARINPEPIFVLGNQKSGTSAIASLLGELTGRSVTVDLRREISDQLIPRIMKGEASVEQLIRRNRMGFASQIIKHPNLTLIHALLADRFPRARWVFVVRDPRDNIRSILDRLGIPGTKTRVTREEWAEIPRAWQGVLGGDPTTNPIASLAARWNLLLNPYLVHSDQMILIRYEDFVLDKSKAIRLLADEIGLEVRGNILKRVDHQFQPQGANRGVDPLKFFGVENLTTIELLCISGMKALGYERTIQSRAVSSARR